MHSQFHVRMKFIFYIRPVLRYSGILIENVTIPNLCDNLICFYRNTLSRWENFIWIHIIIHIINYYLKKKCINFHQSEVSFFVKKIEGPPISSSSVRDLMHSDMCSYGFSPRAVPCLASLFNTWPGYWIGNRQHFLELPKQHCCSKQM